VYVPFYLQADYDWDEPKEAPRLNVTPYSPDCLDLLHRGYTTDGVYVIQPPGGAVTETWCDMEFGGWTILVRRQDGSVDFYRSWAPYVAGFGNRAGNITFSNVKQVKLPVSYAITAPFLNRKNIKLETN